MQLSLRNIYHFFRDAGRTIIRRELDSPDLIILDEKQAVYASVAKSACSSIKTAITEPPPDGIAIHDHISHLSRRRIPKNKRSYYVFTFVRNPYDRLSSCYRSKFNMEDESKFIYSNYLFGYLRNDDTFDQFVKKVCRIPDFLSDRHFKSQNNIVFSPGTNVEYIGKVENLPGDFDDLKEKFGFLDLTHRYKTSGKTSEELYTDETREMVYKRFRKDFEVFNYEK
jgi:hypothetical protein|tara:strand:+ start:1233 stop:1907 length:675 start_codon:yes stop_codon:yes gene_type:complete